MIWLILGIALWWGAHLYKRVAPAARSDLAEKMGDKAKGIFAVLIVLSVVLMVVGFRGAPTIAIYDPPFWMVHINNLLMLVAVILMGLGSSKSPLRAKMRHPMLTGVLIWAVAHLLVNGDLYSVILFGSMAVWALVEIRVINAAVPDYQPYAGGSNAGTLRLLVISAVVFAVIVAIHTWLGYRPFPG